VEGNRRDGKGGWGVPMENRSSKLVKLCCSRDRGIWRNLYAWLVAALYDWYVEGVWRKVLEFVYGAKWCFFGEYGGEFLYGARWCFFQQKGEGFFVWGKVVFFPAKMEGSFCMEQSDVFFGDYEGK
jgi:hypothetical protein